MVKEWAIYMDKETGQFYVRNTIKSGFPSDPYRYLYVDSSESIEEIKESLINCVRLGYEGYSKYKIGELIKKEKNPRVKRALRKFLSLYRNN